MCFLQADEVRAVRGADRSIGTARVSSAPRYDPHRHVLSVKQLGEIQNSESKGEADESERHGDRRLGRSQRSF